MNSTIIDKMFAISNGQKKFTTPLVFLLLYQYKWISKSLIQIDLIYYSLFEKGVSRTDNSTSLCKITFRANAFLRRETTNCVVFSVINIRNSYFPLGRLPPRLIFVSFVEAFNRFSFVECCYYKQICRKQIFLQNRRGLFTSLYLSRRLN